MRLFLRILIGAGLFLALAVPQGLTTDASLTDQITWQIDAIRQGTVNAAVFLQPVRETKRGPAYYNLARAMGRKIRIEPILALRYSSAGFELAPEYVPSGVLWLTPGVKVSGTFPLFAPYINLWIYTWGRFDKHTAVSLAGEQISETTRLFPYNPELNADFHTRTHWPDHGVDFDEGQGGISLMSANFELSFGKFRASAGPSLHSNLGISNQTPGFSQIHLHYKISQKLHFTYLLGSLYSNIPDLSVYNQIYADTLTSKDKYPVYARYVAHHRLDYLPVKNIRIGLYEQVIFGGTGSILNYVNPVYPYWSAQHALGDIDNIQMGLDGEWILAQTLIYGAFFMDEWAPYKTFSQTKNHNWFAVQGGISRLIDFSGHAVFVNLEYTWCDPRTYIHRFAINNPQHYDYNLGFWSGGNSDDWFFLVQSVIRTGMILRFTAEQTRWGEQDVAAIYDQNEHAFLAGVVYRRGLVKLELEQQLNDTFVLDLALTAYATDQLYYRDKFNDLMVSIRYNIPR